MLRPGSPSYRWLLPSQHNKDGLLHLSSHIDVNSFVEEGDQACLASGGK